MPDTTPEQGFNAAKMITIYRIAGDDAIHLTVDGEKIGAFGPSTTKAMALLRLDAELRALKERPTETAPAGDAEKLADELDMPGTQIDVLWPTPAGSTDRRALSKSDCDLIIASLRAAPQWRTPTADDMAFIARMKKTPIKDIDRADRCAMIDLLHKLTSPLPVQKGE
jgi:hypothetical protein